jgi:hypothetical protein
VLIKHLKNKFLAERKLHERASPVRNYGLIWLGMVTPLPSWVLFLAYVSSACERGVTAKATAKGFNLWYVSISLDVFSSELSLETQFFFLKTCQNKCVQNVQICIYIYIHTRFSNLLIYAFIFCCIYLYILIYIYTCVCVRSMFCLHFHDLRDQKQAPCKRRSWRLSTKSPKRCAAVWRTQLAPWTSFILIAQHRITKSILAYKYKCMPVQVVYLCSCQLLRVSSHSVLYQLSKEWGLHSMHSIQTNFELWRKNPITV